MTRALAWVRKSKGSDDDIGLEDQREQVFGLAKEIADEYEKVDLGVQTGFSSMTRDGDGLLDDHPQVQAAINGLENGEYDYLVAYDDRRVCRDGYMRIIEYAAKQGGCEFVYVGDVTEDELTHDIKRRIERDTKEEEIEKARRAVQRRQEQGFWQGRPPFGLEFDENGEYLQPSDKFHTAIRILELRDEGATYSEVAAETEVPRGTAHRIVEREDLYRQHA